MDPAYKVAYITPAIRLCGVTVPKSVISPGDPLSKINENQQT